MDAVLRKIAAASPQPRRFTEETLTRLSQMFRQPSPSMYDDFRAVVSGYNLNTLQQDRLHDFLDEANGSRVEDYFVYQNILYRLNPETGEWEKLLGSGGLEWYRVNLIFLRGVPPYHASMEWHYNQALNSEEVYKCSLSGECERDSSGEPLANCQATCQGSNNKEVTYLALSYDPLQAFDFPPSDQIRVVYDLIGKRVSAFNAERILLALADDVWEEQRSIPDLREYLEAKYTPLEILVRDITSLLKVNPRFLNFEALGNAFQEILEGETGEAFRQPPPPFFAIDQQMRYVLLIAELTKLWTFQKVEGELLNDLGTILKQNRALIDAAGR